MMRAGTAVYRSVEGVSGPWSNSEPDAIVVKHLQRSLAGATLSGMRYRPLGNTGLSVSAVGLGGVPLSIPETRPDQERMELRWNRWLSQRTSTVSTISVGPSPKWTVRLLCECPPVPPTI